MPERCIQKRNGQRSWLGYGLTWLLAMMLARETADADTLVFSNRGDKTVTFVDTDTRQVIAEIETPTGLHEFAVSPDGTNIVGSCYGSGPGHREPDRRLIAIDVKTLEARTIDLGDNPRPNDLRFSQDGERLWVTSERRRQLLEVSVAAGKIVRQIPIDVPAGHMLGVNSKFAFVPCVATGELCKVSLRAAEDKNPFAKKISLAAGAEGIDVSPSGKQVWVASNRANKVFAVDGESMKVIHEIDQDGFPFRIRFAESGAKVLVVCPMSNRLAVFDSDSGKRVEQIEVKGQPTALTISSDGKRAFVVCAQAEVIVEVDLRQNKVIHCYPTGNTPDAIAITKCVPSPDAIKRVSHEGTKLGDSTHGETTIAVNSIDQEQDARAILERAIEVRGGHERLERLNAVRVDSTWSRNGIKTDELVENLQDGKYLATFQSVDGSQSVHGFDGDVIWETNATGTKRFAQHRNVRFCERLPNKFCFERGILNGEFEIELSGEEKAADDVVQVVSYRRIGHKPSSLMFFSKSSGLLVRHDEYAFPDTSKPTRSTTYSDYRNFEGWQIPFRSVTVNADGTSRERTIHRVQFEERPDSDFGVPAAHELKPR